MGDNNKNLKIMIKKYKPDGFDWMNFALTRRNPYTFHHIVSKSSGGGDRVENGAILTRRAHNLLHILEYVCPEAYQDLQNIFISINRSNKPISNEFIKAIDDILHAVFEKNGYEFIIDADLDEYMDNYYGTNKNKVKKLRK